MSKPYSKKFYHSKAWKQCRASYIAKVYGLCERCLDNGRLIPGYIVHHKIEITPENINDPAITLNHENLQYVCSDCHNVLHKRQRSFRNDIQFDDEGNVIGGITMKLKIVYGAPCSGKSSYVRNHIGDNDLVYDYDEIVSALTYSRVRTTHKKNVHEYVTGFRSLILSKAKDEQDIDTMWIITSFLSEGFQTLIHDMKPEYIKMDVSMDECISRLQSDDSRPNKEEWEDIIRSWFEEYNERKYEIIIEEKGRTYNFATRFKKDEVERIKNSVRYRFSKIKIIKHE